MPKTKNQEFQYVWLEAFVLTVRLDSQKAAAAHLGRTSVSRLLKSLESWLGGAKLMAKSPKGLTPDGICFYIFASQIVDLLAFCKRSLPIENLSEQDVSELKLKSEQLMQAASFEMMKSMFAGGGISDSKPPKFSFDQHPNQFTNYIDILTGAFNPETLTSEKHRVITKKFDTGFSKSS